MTPADPPPDPTGLLPLPPHLFLLLLVLEAGPLHGYGIKKAILERSGGRVDLDPGGLYRLLGRLEDQGLLQPVEVDEPVDPRRKHYGLTPLGGRVLRAEARRMAALLGDPEVAALAGET